jgi:hypothetical protein
MGFMAEVQETCIVDCAVKFFSLCRLLILDSRFLILDIIDEQSCRVVGGLGGVTWGEEGPLHSHRVYRFQFEF